MKKEEKERHKDSSAKKKKKCLSQSAGLRPRRLQQPMMGTCLSRQEDTFTPTAPAAALTVEAKQRGHGI